jgi:ABC-type multidrug transport system ATPase subunit
MQTTEPEEILRARGPTDGDEVLRVDGLTKRYGRRTVLDEVSFTVRRGDIFGFLGPNGAGKTTTIRIVLGLVRSTAGRVFLFGEPRRGAALSALARIGAMVEVPSFYPHLSGRQNLRVSGILAGREDPEAESRVLRTVGLAEPADDPVRTYSQGMRQRLGIAQALLTEPELVILDEPTNGLDPHGVREVRGLIADLNREKGLTFLISSHLLPELEQIANRVAILRRGRLLVSGRVEEILAGEGSFVVIEAETPEGAHSVLTESHEAEVRPGGDVRVRAEPGEVPALVERLVASGVRVRKAVCERPSLEDYFLRVTRGGEADLGR